MAIRGSFCRSTKWLKEKTFLFISHQFHMFLEGRFFYPQLWGWLAGVLFVDQQNGLKRKLFSTFRINFTCFGKVDFFQPQLWGWIPRVVFVDLQNGSKGMCFTWFCTNFTRFWRVEFFSAPTLGVASGGSFELWPEWIPIPVSTRGLLHVLIGLAQIWVLQDAPFPCQL